MELLAIKFIENLTGPIYRVNFVTLKSKKRTSYFSLYCLTQDGPMCFGLSYMFNSGWTLESSSMTHPINLK